MTACVNEERETAISLDPERAAARSASRRKQLVAVFAAFDLDGSGFVEPVELFELGVARRILKHKSAPWDPERNAAFIKRLDANQDGLISQDEFVTLFEIELTWGQRDFSWIIDQFTDAAGWVQQQKQLMRSSNCASWDEWIKQTTGLNITTEAPKPPDAADTKPTDVKPVRARRGSMESRVDSLMGNKNKSNRPDAGSSKAEPKDEQKSDEQKKKERRASVARKADEMMGIKGRDPAAATNSKVQPTGNTTAAGSNSEGSGNTKKADVKPAAASRRASSGGGFGSRVDSLMGKPAQSSSNKANDKATSSSSTAESKPVTPPSDEASTGSTKAADEAATKASSHKAKNASRQSEPREAGDQTGGGSGSISPGTRKSLAQEKEADHVQTSQSERNAPESYALNTAERNQAASTSKDPSNGTSDADGTQPSDAPEAPGQGDAASAKDKFVARSRSPSPQRAAPHQEAATDEASKAGRVRMCDEGTVGEPPNEGNSSQASNGMEEATSSPMAEKMNEIKQIRSDKSKQDEADSVHVPAAEAAEAIGADDEGVCSWQSDDSKVTRQEFVAAGGNAIDFDRWDADGNGALGRSELGALVAAQEAADELDPAAMATERALSRSTAAISRARNSRAADWGVASPAASAAAAASPAPAAMPEPDQSNLNSSTQDPLRPQMSPQLHASDLSSPQVASARCSSPEETSASWAPSDSDEECAWCPGSPTNQQGLDLVNAKLARQQQQNPLNRSANSRRLGDTTEEQMWEATIGQHNLEVLNTDSKSLQVRLLSDKSTLDSLSRANALHRGSEAPGGVLRQEQTDELESLRNQLHAAKADCENLEAQNKLLLHEVEQSSNEVVQVCSQAVSIKEELATVREESQAKDLVLEQISQSRNGLQRQVEETRALVLDEKANVASSMTKVREAVEQQHAAERKAAMHEAELTGRDDALQAATEQRKSREDELQICLDNLTRERNERAAAEAEMTSLMQQLREDLEERSGEVAAHLEAVQEAVLAKQQMATQLEQSLEVTAEMEKVTHAAAAEASKQRSEVLQDQSAAGRELEAQIIKLKKQLTSSQSEIAEAQAETAEAQAETAAAHTETATAQAETEHVKNSAIEQMQWMQQQHQRAVDDWEQALVQFETQAAANAELSQMLRTAKKSARQSLAQAERDDGMAVLSTVGRWGLRVVGGIASRWSANAEAEESEPYPSAYGLVSFSGSSPAPVNRVLEVLQEHVHRLIHGALGVAVQRWRRKHEHDKMGALQQIRAADVLQSVVAAQKPKPPSTVRHRAIPQPQNAMERVRDALQHVIAASEKTLISRLVLAWATNAAAAQGDAKQLLLQKYEWLKIAPGEEDPGVQPAQLLQAATELRLKGRQLEADGMAGLSTTARQIQQLQSANQIGSSLGMVNTARMLQRLAHIKQSSFEEKALMEDAVGKGMEMARQLQHAGLGDKASQMEAAVVATATLVRSDVNPTGWRDRAKSARPNRIARDRARGW